MASLTVHLAVVNIMACSLIGISTMISLFAFNILMKRPIMGINHKESEKHTQNKSFSSDRNSNGNICSSQTSNHSQSTPLFSQSSSSPKLSPPLSSSSTSTTTSLIKNKSSSNSSEGNIIEPMNETYQSKWMKKLLSFAVGGLLGDVFLHLLPEAATQLESLNYNATDIQRYLGLWIVMGVFVFLIFETSFTQLLESGQDESEHTEISIKVTGYMNLMANAFDNFSHGMSVGASFLVSYKAGCLTTLAIIIHEIPHEIADHAILIRSGFTIWEAFKAQMSICLVTIFGAIVVLLCGSSSETINLTLWILPLTAGGFIYIALTTLLPEVLDFSDIEYETEVKYSKLSHKSIKCKKMSQRIFFLLAGIFVMAAVNVFEIF